MWSGFKSKHFEKWEKGSETKGDKKELIRSHRRKVEQKRKKGRKVKDGGQEK